MVKMTESSHRTPPHPNSQSNNPPPPRLFTILYFLDSTYVLVVLIYTEDNKTLNNNVSNICQHLKLDLRKKKPKKTINFFAGKFQRFSGFCFFTHTIQHLFHFCNFLFEGNALTTNEACRFHRKLERYVTRGHYWASREIRRKIL